ncbi:MAG: phosphoenolpyruvate synthase, partial [bacterium]|nr:phosphoenolpyruvate synthase [bacterium]
GTANLEKAESLQQVATHIKKVIMDGEMSEVLANDIIAAYKTLGGPMMQQLVAVRSSATAEDLPNASFAGQQETFLNVQGEANLLLKVKAAWASLFEARAIFYRNEQHFNHFRVGIAIVVQKMVASDKSGVMFTIDPVTNDTSKIVIEAVYGLGEMIVQGAVTPDHYELTKTDHQITVKTPVLQEKMMVKKGRENKILTVPKNEQKKQKISDKQIEKLAILGKQLEKHYYFPQDIEWAIEGDDVYIVQTRPITTIDTKKQIESHEQSSELSQMRVMLTGSPASPGISSGPVKIITSVKEIGKVVAGDVLVAPQTNPDYVPAMKKAVAIVTEKGGRTSHAAIVSRELGIPAVVGAEGATKTLKQEEVVTVNGKEGLVYKGGFQGKKTQDAGPIEHIKTATNVYVNLAQPDIAEKVSKMGADGIGLLRAEFMMANIGVHPKKMLRDGKRHEYIKKLAEQMAMFAKPFNPRPVVYRTGDFKTNEYRGLVGGKQYEPLEENPMIGYRGAFRYMHDPEVFDMELEAIKIVRNKMGLKNLWVMIPFVRTVAELISVKKLLSEAGLYRSNSFKLWMMVEIPSNFILLDEFINVGIDGVSIGSNDLTMLILGTDRDNSEVASEYDEQNPAVLWALERIITTAKRRKVTCSICGQAPSQYPDLVEKLVKWGVTSVSVSPDAINDTRKIVAAAEKKVFANK